MRYLLALGLGLALLVSPGCSPTSSGEPDAAPSDCGLLEVEADADPSLVPPSLLIEESEVATTQTQEGRLLVALNVRLSVDASFTAYKKALGEAELEILQEDNEGFEAELYVAAGKELGSLVIRRSVCDDAVVVYLNLPAEKPLRS